MIKKLILTTLTIIFLLSPILIFTEQNTYRQELLKWLNNDSRGRRYLGYEDFLSGLFDSAAKEGIPAELLMNKLREGAAKNVPPQRLIAALSKEQERLKTARGILEDYGIKFEKTEDYYDTLKHLSIILLGGVEEKTLRNLIDISIDTSPGTSVDFSGLLLACDVLVQFNSIDILTQDEMYDLGKSLLLSKLKPAAYSNLASLYLSARARRVRKTELLKLIETTLLHGGGLIQLDQEISERYRKR